MSYYLWFILFAIIVYMMVVDENVSTAIVYVFKLIDIKLQRWKWFILNHPGNPINRYLIWRRSWRMAKELEKEFKLSHDKNEHS